MKKFLPVFSFFISLFLLCGSPACTPLKTSAASEVSQPAASPADTGYRIGGEWLQLQDGKFEKQAAPGAAAKIEVELSGNGPLGDIDHDGDEDVVVFLTYQGGGSGTFTYLAAAVRKGNIFQGTNGILLGDRIGSPVAELQNGLITVRYLDRDRNETMAARPSVPQTRYFILEDSILREIVPGPDEKVLQGWLTIGHEVRSFLPCNEREDLWLHGSPNELAVIMEEYHTMMADYPPYTPAFAILTGRRTAQPREGFGTDYREGLSASRLVMLWPRGNCRSDFILLDSPQPGADLSSPFTVKGRARGNWFFEGDFPVILLDAQGNTITVSYVTAKGAWMTESFVEFEGSVAFTGPFSGRRGTLVLKKDNPTGQSRFDDFLEIPIHFK